MRHFHLTLLSSALILIVVFSCLYDDSTNIVRVAAADNPSNVFRQGDGSFIYGSDSEKERVLQQCHLQASDDPAYAAAKVLQQALLQTSSSSGDASSNGTRADLIIVSAPYREAITGRYVVSVCLFARAQFSSSSCTGAAENPHFIFR